MSKPTRRKCVYTPKSLRAPGGKDLKRTRFTLFYVAGYLLFGGVFLVSAPSLALKLFQSTGNYGDVLPRLLGTLLLVLGVIVAQIIRHRVEVLYATTVVVRLIILAALAGLFFQSSDPLFLVLIAIVGIGVLLTGTSYLLERRQPSSA